MRELLERIYREHRQGLYTLALSLTRHGPAAEDAVQEAFARLCRKTQPPEGDPVPYVFATVRNMALDFVRRPQRPKPGSDSIFEKLRDPATPPPDQLAIADERDNLLQKALEELPESQQEVVVMKLYAGLTFEQIARALDEPLSTVSSRYQRSLEQLRKNVEALV